MTELEIAKTEYYDKYFGHEMAKIGPNKDRYMLVLCATGLRGKPLTDIQIETRNHIFQNWDEIFKDVIIKEDDNIENLLIDLEGNADIKTYNGEKISIYKREV